MLNVTDEHPAPLPRPTPPAPEGAKLRPHLPRWPVWVVAVLVSATTVAVLVWLWRWIDGLALTDVEKRATAQLDALKLAASIVVGGGGLFALYLAARRQRTQELELDARHAELAQRDRVQAHAEQVAEMNRLHAERVAEDARVHAEAQRVTELYGKSVEQLGSDKAPVRLGGLYAMERLAQDNPERPALRQTVVDVICAYLRMPFTLPGDLLADDVDEQARSRYEERVQEREVRLTAQRILAAHLRPGPGLKSEKLVDSFWPDVDLDLTGATLVDFNFGHCQPRRARFGKATFSGWTRFDKATFVGNVNFTGAAFIGDVDFYGVKFAGNAQFNEVRFGADVRFVEVVFERMVTFNESSFNRETWFTKAEFLEYVEFLGVVFGGRVEFGGAAFCAVTKFFGATSNGFAEFGQTISGERSLVADSAVAHSSWPFGWKVANEHAPVEGREGTWHHLVPVVSDTSGDDGDKPTGTR